MQPVDHLRSYSPFCWELGLLGQNRPRRTPPVVKTCSRSTASCTYYYFLPACPNTSFVAVRSLVAGGVFLSLSTATVRLRGVRMNCLLTY